MKPGRQQQTWPRHALNATFVWYLVMLAFHGEALNLTALVQALGLSLLVGTLLTGNALGGGPLRRRQVARFYLIPFCVASFTAATASAGFIVIFSPSLPENGLAALLAATPLLRLHRLPPFWFLLAVLARVARAWQAPAGPVPLPRTLLGWRMLIGGEAVMLLGLAALLGTWLALLPIPIFMAVIQLGFILPEERLLQERFGSAYQSYRRRARRWV